MIITSMLFFVLGCIACIAHAFIDQNYDLAIFYMLASAASSLIDIAKGRYDLGDM